MSAIPIERRRMPLLAQLPLRGDRRVPLGEPRRIADPSLTLRQREVLGLLIRGLTNKEIAAELGVGPDAVKRVISRLLIKLDAPSRTALAQQALRTPAARERSRAPNALGILEAVPIPALVTRGPNHVVEYANPKAREVLSEIPDRSPLGLLLPTASRSSVTRIANESFAAGSLRVTRVALREIVQVGATWQHADVFVSPMYDGAQRIAGLVIFLVDLRVEPHQLR